MRAQPCVLPALGFYSNPKPEIRHCPLLNARLTPFCEPPAVSQGLLSCDPRYILLSVFLERIARLCLAKIPTRKVLSSRTSYIHTAECARYDLGKALLPALGFYNLQVSHMIL